MSSYDPHGVRLRDADRVFLEDRPHRVYLCALTAQEQPGMCSARGGEVSAQSAAMSMLSAGLRKDGRAEAQTWKLTKTLKPL